MNAGNPRNSNRHDRPFGDPASSIRICKPLAPPTNRPRTPASSTSLSSAGKSIIAYSDRGREVVRATCSTLSEQSYGDFGAGLRSWHDLPQRAAHARRIALKNGVFRARGGLWMAEATMRKVGSRLRGTRTSASCDETLPNPTMPAAPLLAPPRIGAKNLVPRSAYEDRPVSRYARAASSAGLSS